MKIDENNILNSFREVECGLTQNGVRPLDSYVVDDGWNAYGPFEKENTVKFWSFNSKFPHELATPSKLAHQFASDFGLWLDPVEDIAIIADLPSTLRKMVMVNGTKMQMISALTIKSICKS